MVGVKSYSQCLDYIRSDYYRVTGRANDSLLRMWLYSHLDLGLKYMFWHRLANCSNILVGGSESCQMEDGGEVSYRHSTNHQDWLRLSVDARRPGGDQCLCGDR